VEQDRVAEEHRPHNPLRRLQPHQRRRARPRQQRPLSLRLQQTHNRPRQVVRHLQVKAVRAEEDEDEATPPVTRRLIG